MKQIIILLTLIFIAFPGILSAQNKKEKKKNYCIECHSGLAGRLKKPVKVWRKSVHGIAGNECNLCHGGNPDVSDKKMAKLLKYKFIGKPDKKQITDFCGRGGCHSLALKQFKRGPHYQSVLKSNSPNCTHCHGVHNIQRSSSRIIKEKACISCHKPEYSRQIIRTINQIESKIAAVENNINYLNEKSVEVKFLGSKLSKTKHLFHQLVHVFSKQAMDSTKEIIQVRVDDLLNSSKSKVAISKRLDLLYIMMLAFGVIIVGGFSIYTILMFMRRKH